MSYEDPLSLIENRTLERERRSTYWCMPAIPSLSLFLSLFLIFLFFFPFLSFSQYLFPCSDFLLEVTITIPLLLLVVHGKGPFYSAYCDQFLLFQPLIHLSDMGVLADHYQFVSRPAITTYLCWLCHQTKKTILFVCLSWHSYLLRCGCSISLPILHGMHLMVPTHLCFFWAVCHPSKTFPPKEPEQEPQNKFSPFPTTRPCPLISDP